MVNAACNQSATLTHLSHISTTLPWQPLPQEYVSQCIWKKKYLKILQDFLFLYCTKDFISNQEWKIIYVLITIYAKRCLKVLRYISLTCNNKMHLSISAVCAYKSKMYFQGQTWKDGCQYQCTCIDASKGLYSCEQL